MPRVVEQLLERNKMGLDDVDLLIMHQANLRINEAVQKRLGLPVDKVFNNIQHCGNTTAGTIPIAVHEAREQGRVHAGDTYFLQGEKQTVKWPLAFGRT